MTDKPHLQVIEPDNVEYLHQVTKLDIDCDRVLQAAVGKLRNVVVVGYDKEGEEFFASSISDGGTVVWLMERVKLKLLRLPDEYGLESGPGSPGA